MDQPLPGYTDFLRDGVGPLLCRVLSIPDPIDLPWQYNEEQVQKGRTWQCDTLWLHDVSGVYDTQLYADLEEVLQSLRQNTEPARYTLLVDERGMFYDRNRFGGDYQLRSTSGRWFSLSVRRGTEPDEKIMLSIAWGR